VTGSINLKPAAGFDPPPLLFTKCFFINFHFRRQTAGQFSLPGGHMFNHRISVSHSRKKNHAVEHRAISGINHVRLAVAQVRVRDCDPVRAVVRVNAELEFLGMNLVRQPLDAIRKLAGNGISLDDAVGIAGTGPAVVNVDELVSGGLHAVGGDDIGGVGDGGFADAATVAVPIIPALWGVSARLLVRAMATWDDRNGNSQQRKRATGGRLVPRWQSASDTGFMIDF
jgi:hypothetical protein